jgi:hypothetical protein
MKNAILQPGEITEQIQLRVADSLVITIADIESAIARSPDRIARLAVGPRMGGRRPITR